VPIADLLPGFGVVAVACGLIMALGFWTRRLNTYHISLSSDGIEFSKGWGSDLLNRLKRIWDDLYSVEMVEPLWASNEAIATSHPGGERDGLCPDLDEIVARATQIDTGRRYARVWEVKEDLTGSKIQVNESAPDIQKR